MTRKRTIAIMPDGTLIKERSSFVLRTDVVGLITAGDIEAMKNIDPDDPNWGELVAKAGYLDIAAKMLLEADEHSIAIPVSSTIYASHPETARLVRAQQEQLLTQTRKELEKERQLIKEQQDLAEARELQVMRQEGTVLGLYYSGPKITLE
jgi:hypothetical protein